MRIITLSLLLCGLVIQSFGVRPPLKGYTYASEQAPTGKEWQSPENLALNKEHLTSSLQKPLFYNYLINRIL